jgi:hypothetical protein
MVGPRCEPAALNVTSLDPGDDDPMEHDVGVWYFAYAAADEGPEAALRAAVAEYLALPDSNPNRDRTFNWGDALEEVPDAVWARHGLRPLPPLPTALQVVVDHDEVLVDNNEDEEVADGGG